MKYLVLFAAAVAIGAIISEAKHIVRSMKDDKRSPEEG